MYAPPESRRPSAMSIMTYKYLLTIIYPWVLPCSIPAIVTNAPIIKPAPISNKNGEIIHHQLHAITPHSFKIINKIPSNSNNGKYFTN